jgi:hypothetical protein
MDYLFQWTEHNENSGLPLPTHNMKLHTQHDLRYMLPIRPIEQHNTDTYTHVRTSPLHPSRLIFDSSRVDALE